MLWTEILSSSPGAMWIDGKRTSFVELADIAVNLQPKGESWEPAWTIPSLAEFFHRLDLRESFAVGTAPAGGDKIPTIDEPLIYLRSSGTEGPSRWIGHRFETLQSVVPLYRSTRAAAVLRPGHAAGIQYLLGGVLGGNELWPCRSGSELRDLKVSVLQGPPTVLAWLLNFKSQYDDFLRGLKFFYSGTENLHPSIVEKLKRSGLSLRIHQVYGTTETWGIETDTHPDSPWLVRITDPAVSLVNGELHIRGDRLSPSVSPPFIPGDRWDAVDGDWGMITSDRLWAMNFHGEKINLFDLEDRLLRIPGVADVTIQQEKHFLSGILRITVSSDTFSGAMEDEIKKLVELPEGAFVLEWELPGDIPLGKRRRN